MKMVVVELVGESGCLTKGQRLTDVQFKKIVEACCDQGKLYPTAHYAQNPNMTEKEKKACLGACGMIWCEYVNVDGRKLFIAKHPDYPENVSYCFMDENGNPEVIDDGSANWTDVDEYSLEEEDREDMGNIREILDALHQVHLEYDGVVQNEATDLVFMGTYEQCKDFIQKNWDKYTVGQQSLGVSFNNRAVSVVFN